LRVAGARDCQARRIGETFRDALVEQRKFGLNGFATIGRGHHEQAVEQRPQLSANLD
jgi:hypothetical protein